jgi:two-component system, NarL family, nitrate/nitrite response regulator NarL
MERSAQAGDAEQKRVLIIDDHSLVASLSAIALERMGDFKCFCVTDVAAGLEMIRAEHIDVVLLDLALPGEIGLSGMERILSAAPDMPIVLFSGNDVDGIVSQGLANGARGFIPKTLALKSAASALRLVCDGCDFVPMNFVLKPVERRTARSNLTGIEVEMLQLFSRGASLKEVSHDFGISVSMTKNRSRQIFRKLGTANRAHAVMRAKELQII